MPTCLIAVSLERPFHGAMLLNSSNGRNVHIDTSLEKAVLTAGNITVDAIAIRKRIVFVIAHLGPGGAQRVASTAANALAARGVEIHVITTLTTPPDAYTLDPRVLRHQSAAPRAAARVLEELGDEVLREARDFRESAEIVSLPGGRESSTVSAAPLFWPSVESIRRLTIRALTPVLFSAQLMKRAWWLRKRIGSIAPDAVLSFLTQTNILTVLATRGLPVRIVVSERNDPRRQQHRRRVVLMRKLLYRWSDVVTANSHGALDALQEIVPKQKLAFLPNPLAAGNDGPAAFFAGPTLISVTRLVEQKGVDILLRAAARAFQALPGWRLALVGDGPLRAELQRLAIELGIDSRVDWLGHVANPIPYLKAARVFVLTSRFEGSPNALLEAMACGLPSIVSDASPGPLELIGKEEAGLVVPTEDHEATAVAIVRLATDETLRARLGASAIERTRVHELEGAMDVWLKLLNCA